MAVILLTGASSFTGMWIAEALVGRGHAVIAPLRRPLDAYAGIRAARLQRLAGQVELVPDHPFASPQFLDLVRARDVALLAHHAADIPGYGRPDYDAIAGFHRNTEGVPEALGALAGRAAAVAVTGTVFESGEGVGPGSDRAVSPYGLSQGLRNAAIEQLADRLGLGFGKFVIANPFGPMEEGRMVWSLFQAWFAGQPGVVRTPAYVRDNIPVTALAAAYADMTEDLLGGLRRRIARPSGIVGPQGQFARKVAAEAQPRLGRSCQVFEQAQTALAEPYIRINSEPRLLGDWGESAFWDAYVDYYRQAEASGALRPS